MFTLEEFEKLSPGVRARIVSDSIAKANGEMTNHSFEDLVSQNRHLAIASRMTSKALQFCEMTLENKNVQKTGNIKAYTGADIASIFVDSVNKYGYTYYPLTGDWTKTGVKQLVLFVKTNGAYMPYARFSIDDIESNETMEYKHLNALTDITPALSCSHKSLLRISNVQTTSLPTLFLGLRSGVELQKSAFKGSSPNVIMI